MGRAALAAAAAAVLTTAASSAQAGALERCRDVAPAAYLLPGTDTCFAVGGVLRSEVLYVEPKGFGTLSGRALDATGFGSGILTTFDARSSTPYGVLRGFVATEFLWESGALIDGIGGATQTRADLDKAFIEFAGFTFGLTRSFFDFYGNRASFGFVGGSDEDSVNLAAWSADLGRGWRLHLAAEDTTARRQEGGNIDPAGVAAPDVVAALRYSNHGLVREAQVSGVVRQLRFSGLGPGTDAPATRAGHAVQAGLALDAGALLRAGTLWLQAAYAEGALGYLGFGNVFTSLGRQNLDQAEFLAMAGGVELTRGWSATAALTWWPVRRLRHGVFAATTHIDYAPGVAALGRYVDAYLSQIGTNLVWSPVADLELGVEFIHHRVDTDGRVPGGGPRSESVGEARVRAKRYF